ncbi:MAG: ribosome assembly RNA-binding protein YhbY [Firmicutes bacterium]|nr:ribosome assembly RNA-binding protein YhbY [Bacillota bacterium]
MITSKQRSYLRSLAHNIDPLVYIGKQGVTENVVKELDQCLENRELVKVKIQEGFEADPKELANEMAEQLGAEFVQAIGRKFSLYRQSSDPEKRQIVLPKAKK